jgi:hypothetical protein
VIQQFRYEDAGINEAWQLVPAVLSTYTPSRILENYDYRENGYWHICRSQLMFRNESDPLRRYDAPCSAVYHDDRAAMRGSLIEATFEPGWVEYAPWAPARGVKRGAVQGKVPRFGWSNAGGGDDGGGGEHYDEGGEEEEGRRYASPRPPTPPVGDGAGKDLPRLPTPSEEGEACKGGQVVGSVVRSSSMWPERWSRGFVVETFPCRVDTFPSFSAIRKRVGEPGRPWPASCFTPPPVVVVVLLSIVVLEHLTIQPQPDN